ncbi:hypothetical protein ACFX13_001399 [Malus domestica]
MPNATCRSPIEQDNVSVFVRESPVTGCRGIKIGWWSPQDLRTWPPQRLKGRPTFIQLRPPRWLNGSSLLSAHGGGEIYNTIIEGVPKQLISLIDIAVDSNVPSINFTST